MDWVQLEWFEVPLVLVDLALEALNFLSHADFWS